MLCLIFAFPCLISVLGAVFIFESPKYLLSIGKEEEALEILKKMYVINTRKSGDTFEVSEIGLLVNPYFLSIIINYICLSVTLSRLSHYKDFHEFL